MLPTSRTTTIYSLFICHFLHALLCYVFFDLLYRGAKTFQCKNGHMHGGVSIDAMGESCVEQGEGEAMQWQAK
jgi:hypothetical protein